MAPKAGKRSVRRTLSQVPVPQSQLQSVTQREALEQSPLIQKYADLHRIVLRFLMAEKEAPSIKRVGDFVTCAAKHLSLAMLIDANTSEIPNVAKAIIEVINKKLASVEMCIEGLVSDASVNMYYGLTYLGHHRSAHIASEYTESQIQMLNKLVQRMLVQQRAMKSQDAVLFMSSESQVSITKTKMLLARIVDAKLLEIINTDDDPAEQILIIGCQFNVEFKTDIWREYLDQVFKCSFCAGLSSMPIRCPADSCPQLYHPFCIGTRTRRAEIQGAHYKCTTCQTEWTTDMWNDRVQVAQALAKDIAEDGENNSKTPRATQQVAGKTATQSRSKSQSASDNISSMMEAADDEIAADTGSDDSDDVEVVDTKLSSKMNAVTIRNSQEAGPSNKITRNFSTRKQETGKSRTTRPESSQPAVMQTRRGRSGTVAAPSKFKSVAKKSSGKKRRRVRCESDDESEGESTDDEVLD